MKATAFGAVTIINATATGIGCSLGTTGGVTCEWQWQDQPGLQFNGPTDDRLAKAVHMRLGANRGANVTTSGPPPARGLKTSSSAAAAMVLAALGDDRPDQEADALTVANQAVACCRDAGVTLTGAFDDQIATILGGAHLTDNHAGRILQPFATQPWHVAIWIPDADIPKGLIQDLDARPAVSGARKAILQAQAGDLPGAMTTNGAAFHRLYADAGLPVTDEPTQVALNAGALGAGLSGTGPAVAALFDAPSDLESVKGGSWAWRQAVPSRGEAIP